ncbi:hypothetical protein P879_02055 [Paragonimus westermani]|uniref:Uncharacterized protein n=1 Tax=Paragonimus westermani TaxID=34504 RepID=A0A8T0DVE9_9TREM|nr:hypothetical protein P879_02055 [Paragonimus westermani]
MSTKQRIQEPEVLRRADSMLLSKPDKAAGNFLTNGSVCLQKVTDFLSDPSRFISVFTEEDRTEARSNANQAALYTKDILFLYCFDHLLGASSEALLCTKLVEFSGNYHKPNESHRSAALMHHLCTAKLRLDILAWTVYMRGCTYVSTFTPISDVII